MRVVVLLLLTNQIPGQLLPADHREFQTIKMINHFLPHTTPAQYSPHRFEEGMYIIGVVNDQLQLRAALLLH